MRPPRPESKIPIGFSTVPRAGERYTTTPKEPPFGASLVGWMGMAALALVSTDPTLYHELIDRLEGSEWSVEWLESTAIDDATIDHDVVVLDARHPQAGGWPRPAGTPVLLVVRDGEHADVPDDLVNDIVFRGVTAVEWLVRLERLRTRKPLENLYRRHADALASITQGVVVIGPDLRILFANPRAAEIVGHREETIGGESLERLVAPEQWADIRESLVRRELAHGMDIHWLRRDGARVLCSSSLAPLIGDEEHMVISFEDVTEERDTERELLKSMEFLGSLIDASVDAIIATDMEQRVMLFNPSAERITGHHVSDAVGVLTLEDLLGRGASELVTRRLLTADHGGDGRLEPTMLELVDLHGAHIPVQLSASLIYQHGQPSAIVLIFADLRDRIRVEERLADAQKKLAFTEKQGVLAELAGTAAHELNQPLTSMMAYAELLLRQSEAGSTGAKAAQVLIREAERMAEIVRKIGKITRYETTSYVGQQKIFDLDRAADAPNSDRGTES